MGKNVLIIITETNKKECSELRLHVVKIDILNPGYRNYEKPIFLGQIQVQVYPQSLNITGVIPSQHNPLPRVVVTEEGMLYLELLKEKWDITLTK